MTHPLTQGLTTGVNTGYSPEYKKGGIPVDRQEQLDRIASLTAEISELPKGYISRKVIGSRVYFYHQWSENGSKKARYLRDEEIAPLSEQIERRKALQGELKAAKADLAGLPAGRKKTEDSLSPYLLMHKEVPVAELWLDETTGLIQKTGAVLAEAHLPVGTVFRNSALDRKSINEWWMERSIPASRSGVREALETLEIADTKTLLVRCCGLSLSDQYWIRPEGSNLAWEDINFFTNDFSEDIGDILFGAAKRSNAINFSSPDSTSDGNLKKRWRIIDGRRCLVKGGSNPYRQQPLNEVIATRVMQLLGIPCVPYTVIWNKGAPYSLCADFVDENTELVPARQIARTREQPDNQSLYRHFVNCAEKLGIPGVVPFLDRMIVLDYIILNEDRHLNNFGAVRDARTQEWLGMAPVFDSGNSLGCDKTVFMMKDRDEIICKPFRKTHEEQLKLVTSFDWIDFSALAEVPEIISAVLSDKKAADHLDERRIAAISDLAAWRIEVLETIARAAGR